VNQTVEITAAAAPTVSGGSSTQGSYGQTLPHHPYSIALELASADTINADKGLAPPSEGTTSSCTSGARIKLEDDGDPSTQADSTVYYCGADGRRYVFPDAGTYFSWYQGFGGVTIVSKAVLEVTPIGGNVTYRPGSRMIKIQSDSKVYAVAKGGVLRWVTSETAAAALYGPNWNHQISDTSDAFFVNYILGDPITLADLSSQ
jgi:hypothetical protein